MPETEKTAGPEAGTAKPKGTGASQSGPRSLAMRADRTLKDADRMLNKTPETSPQEKAMTQLEQAKVYALLELAEAIRANKSH